MPDHLHYNTVNRLLLSVLQKLMSGKMFDPFRLVGGTALSLLRGHRRSVDIDLFTDAPYDSIPFGAIDKFLRNNFSYVDTSTDTLTGMGKAFFVGEDAQHSIKLDVFYTDPFISPPVAADGIRLASIQDIIAMKLDVIARGGRKKDFWDIHELMEDHSLDAMLALHEKRYPHAHDAKMIVKGLTNFDRADEDFEPVCLRGKHWELIKLDLIEFAEG